MGRVTPGYATARDRPADVQAMSFQQQTALPVPTRGKETGESALLRTLLSSLRRGDVVLADRYYCSYWMVALLQAQGVEVVFRKHHKRHTDFRRGQRPLAGCAPDPGPCEFLE